MLIQKFGGTSVADANAMREVLTIVQREIQRQPVVVLSACSGATNELIAIVELAAIGNREAVKERINTLKERHLHICRELISASEGLSFVSERIQVLCTELSVFCEGVTLLGECTPRSIAYSSAMGELLSSSIFCAFAQERGVPAIWADARLFMKTDENALKGIVDTQLLKQNAYEMIVKPLREGSVVITQGFIGSDNVGRTTTLGRGGSDYSAALIGAAIDAEEIQIWTDVNGIASTDPRKVPDAFPIEAMSFKEARELAYYGAKVLHPETILPAVEKGITVKVLNTFSSEHSGTTITPEADSSLVGFRAVTLKEHCILADIVSQPNQSARNLSILTDLISEKGYHLYGVISSEGGCRILTEGDKDSVLDFCSVAGLKGVVQVCDMICVVGPHVRSLNDSQNIANSVLFNTVAKQGVLCILYGHSDVGVVLAVEHKKGLEVLKKIHAIITAQ